MKLEKNDSCGDAVDSKPVRTSVPGASDSFKAKVKGKGNSPETLVEGRLVLVERNPGFLQVQTRIILEGRGR